MHLGMHTSGYLRESHRTAMCYLSGSKQCHWGHLGSVVLERCYTSGDATGCAVLKAFGQERVSRVVINAAVTSVAPSDRPFFAFAVEFTLQQRLCFNLRYHRRSRTS